MQYLKYFSGLENELHKSQSSQNSQQISPATLASQQNLSESAEAQHNRIINSKMEKVNLVDTKGLHNSQQVDTSYHYS